MNQASIHRGNFASRTMLQIIYAGLDALSLPHAPPEHKSKNEKIPLKDKQDLLIQIRDQYGLMTLLQLGAGISKLLDLPICSAIAHNSMPHDIFRKWQRLEKYIHSQHYIECEFSDQGVTIRHLSRDQTPPSLEEDLVVLGVMCASVHHVTQSDVHLSALDPVQPVFIYPARHMGTPPRSRNQRWKISWSGGDARNPADAATRHTTPASSIEQIKASMLQLGLIELTLEKVARAQATSTRSLQRLLQQQGQDYSTLLQSVRVTRASQLLLAGQETIAEIGFICGFADQAHFSRTFKQWTGMSPSSYARLEQPLH
ncbi:helix-turn-helix domain-containing protein [Chitinibacteraceae bacterium HSL-7]